MRTFKNERKKIACLEGDWVTSWRDRSSVKPITEVVGAWNRCEVTYHECNTVAEFEYSIKGLARLQGHELLYLAFHGVPGRIQSAGPFDLSLEELADMMGKHFEGRAVHFGSCSTIRVPKERLDSFIESTGVSVVSGFKKDVKWIESTAFELIYFDAWQRYKRPSSLRKHLADKYGELVSRLGFEMYIA